MATSDAVPILNARIYPHKRYKGRALLCALLASTVLLVFQTQTQYRFQDYSVDAGWVTELDNQWSQGNILGRDTFFTYGPLSQVVVRSFSWLRSEPSALYAYGLDLLAFAVFGMAAVALTLYVIREIEWRAAVFIFAFMFFFHTVLILRPFMIVLGMVLLAQAADAPRRRGRVLAVAAGAAWFAAQLITAELIVLALLAAVGWAAVCSLLSIRRFRRWQFQERLVAPRIYIERVGIAIATIVLGNLCLEVLFRLTGGNYGGFDYATVSLAILKGYAYTMGTTWGMDGVVTWVLCLILAFTAVAVTFFLLRSDLPNFHVLSSLMAFACVSLRSAFSRSDIGHILNAVSPFLFVFLLLICWIGAYRRVQIVSLLLLAVLLYLWPLRLLDSVLHLSAMVVKGDISIAGKLREIRYTAIDVDDVVPPPLRELISPDKSVVPFPDSNIVVLLLGNPSLAPILQAYTAHDTRLQQVYTGQIERVKNQVEVLYALASNTSGALDGVQYVSRTPEIFRYFYENFQLVSNDVVRDNWFVLTARSQPRTLQALPLTYTLAQPSPNTLQVTFAEPQSCSLIELQMTIRYPLTASIGRPSQLTMVTQQGGQPLLETRLVPVEVGKPFTTFVYLGAPSSFHHLFRSTSQQLPYRTFDTITFAPTPGDRLTVTPHSVELAGLGCIGAPAAAGNSAMPLAAQDVTMLAYQMPPDYVPGARLSQQGNDIFMHADGSATFGAFQSAEQLCLTGVADLRRPDALPKGADGVDFVVRVEPQAAPPQETRITLESGDFAPFRMPLPVDQPFRITLQTRQRANADWDWAWWDAARIAACTA